MTNLKNIQAALDKAHPGNRYVYVVAVESPRRAASVIYVMPRQRAASVMSELNTSLSFDARYADGSDYIFLNNHNGSYTALKQRSRIFTEGY